MHEGNVAFAVLIIDQLDVFELADVLDAAECTLVFMVQVMIARDEHGPDACCIQLVQAAYAVIHSLDIDTVSIVMEITEEQYDIALSRLG